MRSLNTNFEKSKTPQTEKAAVFGEGNFLRAFIGVLYERMNRNAGYDGGVVLLQGLPNGLAEKINAHFLELTEKTASLREFLKLTEIWGEDLSKRELFAGKAEEYEKKIGEKGIKKVIEELASEV